MSLIQFNGTPEADEVEHRIIEMLENYAGRYGLSRQSFCAAIRPTILQAWIENGQLIIAADPSFSEVFDNLEPEQALRLFEKWHLDELRKRIQFAHELSDADNCFYNLGDWETALSALLAFQEANMEQLLETGYGSNAFDVSPWLERHLRCVYPVKLCHKLPNGMWRIIDKLSRFNTTKPVSYRDAPYLDFLREEDALRLDSPSLRGQVIKLRKEALKKLLKHLGRRGPGQLSHEQALEIATDCLSQGKSHIVRDTMQFLHKQDEDFNLFGPTYGMSRNLPVEAGGLRNLSLVIEQVTTELALRHKSAIRARLSDFPAIPPRVGLSIDLTTIYRDYGEFGGHDFEPIYKAWAERELEQEAFGQQFRKVIENVLENYPVLVPATEITNEHVERTTTLPNSVPSVCYARFPGKVTKWEDVIIAFVSNDTIRVQANGVSKKYTFTEIGFTDGRKGDLPDTRWAILREMSKAGEISYRHRLGDKHRMAAQTAVKDIRKRLKALIGLDDDPFHPYRTVDGYKPKFTLLDGRLGTGDAD